VKPRNFSIILVRHLFVIVIKNLAYVKTMLMVFSSQSSEIKRHASNRFMSEKVERQLNLAPEILRD